MSPPCARHFYVFLASSLFLGGCFLSRAGTLGESGEAGVDAGTDAAGSSEAGIDGGPTGCPPGTVDVDGDPSNGCECALASPATELCNLADDDCDGTVDEDADEACTTMGCGGSRACTGGSLGSCEPTSVMMEVCGGGDEDCDGTVDEGCSCSPPANRPCGSSVGECTEGTQACQGDGTWGGCTGGTGPTDEACNDLDDDCDGTVDDLTRSCGTSMGICSTGTETCAGGSWGSCAGGVSPMPAELCDMARLDEDCDGSSNEGCSCVDGQTRACGTGSCTGTETCDITGTYGSCSAPSAGPEICNGMDDDCNGTIDDGSAGCAAATGCSVHRDRGSVYLLCQPPVAERSWADAQTYCTSQGYHLAVVNDPAENTYIDAITSATLSTEWWIGLSDVDSDSTYEDSEWVSGTSSHRSWGPGEPDQTGQCVFLDNGDMGRWDDKGCGGRRRFVCEAP